MKTQNTTNEVKFNYSNNVNGLNALIKLENQSLGFQLTKIIEVYNKYSKNDVIEFDKIVKRKDKETSEKIETIVKVVFKFCPLQISLVKRMKKDSDLFKFFEAKVRKTKNGNFNLYYTLQSINKFQTELQNFASTTKKVVQ